MRTSADITVSMIHPSTWENDGEIFAITDPIPVDEWLQKVSQRGWEEDNTYLFAIPPVAIPLLAGLLAEDQYRALLSRTPRLSALAGR